MENNNPKESHSEEKNNEAKLTNEQKLELLSKLIKEVDQKLENPEEGKKLTR